MTYAPYNDTEICVDPGDTNLKSITEHHTYYLLKMFSKKSLGLGNFPRQIVAEFTQNSNSLSVTSETVP